MAWDSNLIKVRNRRWVWYLEASNLPAECWWLR